MKKVFLLISLSVSVIFIQAQNLVKVTMTETGTIEKFAYGLQENVQLNIDINGNIMNWGIDRYAGRLWETQPGLLDPYGGRVEYYADNENEAFRGKVKAIGRTVITYYASFDLKELIGKVKSVGNYKFEYYLNVDDELLRGKIKKVGTTPYTWYNSYENDGFKGKLKSIGNTNFTYYNSLDDEGSRGKIKNIGGQSFTYFSAQDLREYRGRMKTGSQMQIINGIKFYVRP
jgi:hypothetical protein